MLKIYKQSLFCEIQGLHSRVTENSKLLVCYTVFVGKELPVISKTAVPSKRLELFIDHHGETSQKTWISNAYPVFHTKIILQLLSPRSVFGMTVQ